MRNSSSNALLSHAKDTKRRHPEMAADDSIEAGAEPDLYHVPSTTTARATHFPVR